MATGWLADIQRESEANAARRLAPAVVRYCDVCEEPAPALTEGRWHRGTFLCAGCLVAEIEIAADMEEG